jgi:hypothetical protein
LADEGDDMDEQRLIEKLRAIEALHAGATTPGERVAAAEARERILERLRTMTRTELPIEFRFKVEDPWKRRLLLALLNRYGIRPYRHRGQRHWSVMARVPRTFVDQTLWPEFVALSAELGRYLDEATTRIIAAGVHRDVQDTAEEVEPPSQLGSGTRVR